MAPAYANTRDVSLARRVGRGDAAHVHMSHATTEKGLESTVSKPDCLMMVHGLCLIDRLTVSSNSRIIGSLCLMWKRPSSQGQPGRQR